MSLRMETSACHTLPQAPFCRGRQGQTSVPCPPSTSALACQRHCSYSLGCHPSTRRRALPRGLLVVRAGPRTPVTEKWWTKGNPDNMRTVTSIQDFVDYLDEAQDKLVVVDFFAKWCNACRALFPKVCQLCGSDPHVLVLKVDWDENKEVCKALNIKVLPYFQLYRGSQGKVAEFSASISKVQKLKDHLEKWSGPKEGVGTLPHLKEFPDTFPSSMTLDVNKGISHQESGQQPAERELQEALAA